MFAFVTKKAPPSTMENKGGIRPSVVWGCSDRTVRLRIRCDSMQVFPVGCESAPVAIKEGLPFEVE